jgi:hypothetical protein
MAFLRDIACRIVRPNLSNMSLVLFCADVEIQCDGLRTRTGTGRYADGDNGRVRGRRAGRSPPAPPLGRPPPDDVWQRRGRVVVAVGVGHRSPAQQTVVLRHTVQGRVRQDDIRPAGQGVRGLLQPVPGTAAPLTVQVRIALPSRSTRRPHRSHAK